MGDQSYTRDFDQTKMVEVEPGWFVNESVWKMLQSRFGVTSVSRQTVDETLVHETQALTNRL